MRCRRWIILLVLAVAALNGCKTTRVARLDLRDPRLPVEARRWLADAEDEVAIARARLDDAEDGLHDLEDYRESLYDRCRDIERGSHVEAQVTWAEYLTDAFDDYAYERVQLEKLELTAARKALQLARARLTLARAETAVRYDVAVYDLEPIALEVEALRDDVAQAERDVEEQRANVERTATEVWKAYTQFVGKQGDTHALWKTR